MILDNRRSTIRDIADDVNISFGLCQATFTNVLGIKRAVEKIVLKLFQIYQRKRKKYENRKNAAHEI